VKTRSARHLLAASAAAVLAAVLVAPPAHAGEADKARAAPSRPANPHVGKKTARLAAPARQAPGRSVGSPTEGKLLGGAHLTEGANVRVVPQYAGGDVRWGLESLVGMLDRAARSVHKQFPDAVMSVGHLSKSGGGEIDHHASHESGRDADVGFYVKNHLGKPVYADHFVQFAGDGTSKVWPGARFDDAKNWALVAALVSDPQAKVTHLFVATPLRARLLAYAERVGVPAALRQRASEVMAQPHGSLPHDDHFHVRIACPVGMEKCIEQPLAKRGGRGAHEHGAVASNAHGRAHGVGASSHAAGAAPSRPTPARPHTDAAKPRDKDDEATAKASKSESIVPSLAPIVPGLDEAVIVSPLVPAKDGPKASEGATSDARPGAPGQPSERPVDDPDGVLE
jgi:penicillin-insensitive murein endopeptidase